MDNKQLYLWKIDRDGALVKEQVMDLTGRSEKQGYTYYSSKHCVLYRLPNGEKRTRGVEDLDKVVSGTMLTYDPDPVKVWDAFAKHFFQDMGKKSIALDKARVKFFEFRKKNPDPRRQNNNDNEDN